MTSSRIRGGKSLPAGSVGRSGKHRGAVEEALRAGLKRYETLVKHLPVGVYRTTPEGRIVEANPALARMLGVRTPSSLLRRSVMDFYVKSADRASHLEKLAGAPTYFKEYELRAANNHRFWVRDYCRALKGTHGATLHFDGILVDITERKLAEKRLERALRDLRASNEKLEAQSLTDELTGLYNRRGFFALGQQQIKIAGRLKEDVVLLYLDVDDLKRVNDTSGHAAGDGVLAAVGSILKKTLRESDAIGRIGGDEFAVLAIRSGSSGGRAIISRIRDRVKAHNLEHPDAPPVSLSAGVLRLRPEAFSSLEACLAHADGLMYRQKQRRARPGP